MKVFVWECIDNCTDHHHSGGGVVVFAEDLEKAKQLAMAKGCLFSKDEQEPDETRTVLSEGKEAVYVMKDAGCC